MENVDDVAVIEAILREEAESNGEFLRHRVDGGWKTVLHKRRSKSSTTPDHIRPHGGASTVDGVSEDVFRLVELEAEERRRRVIESQRAALEAAGVDPGSGSNGLPREKVGYESDVEENAGDDGDQVKRKNKVKKPKVTVAEAAAKIDTHDLALFLTDISALYESQEDIQLMRFADYFARAFGSVASAQFPLAKLLRDSTVEKLINMPLGHISEAVYKPSADWLSHRSAAALGSFILWAWDGILSELNTHQQGNGKRAKKMEHQAPSKTSQVSLFVVLAMTLQRKPDVLISLLPLVKEGSNYLGQDQLPVTLWVISQVCEKDIVVGLHMWVQLLLPMLSEKFCNPRTRDLILQLVERIVSSPKARQMLLNGAVRKGDRLVPPQALDTLMRLTFPSLTARNKATERFEAVYPILKEVALAGSPGSKAMKHVSQQIVSFAIKYAGIPELKVEACDIFIWGLTQHPDCFKLWDDLYVDNIVASVAVLENLSGRLKELQSERMTSLDDLRRVIHSFIKRNCKEVVASERYSTKHAAFKKAESHCKAILKQLSGGRRCWKATIISSITFGVAAVALSHALKPRDLSQLLEKFPAVFGLGEHYCHY